MGKIISWEKEDALKGKILVKARVTDLGDIPKSIRWSKGELFEEESWTCSVEVLLEEMLGGGPADEDPFPPEGVDPHPVPQHANDFPGFPPLPKPNNNAPNEEGIINLVPLVVSHSAGLPLVSENTCSCPNHFAPLMLLPFDRLTITLKTS